MTRSSALSSDQTRCSDLRLRFLVFDFEQSIGRSMTVARVYPPPVTIHQSEGKPNWSLIAS